MQTLGYFTKPELIQLLALIEKEGLQVEVAFDKKFARLYGDTFGIKPVLIRRSSFTMPRVGWYILFADEDEARLKRIVLNSPFAYCLKKPAAEDFPDADVTEKSDLELPAKPVLSHRYLRWLLVLLVLLIISVYLLNKM